MSDVNWIAVGESFTGGDTIKWSDDGKNWNDAISGTFSGDDGFGVASKYSLFVPGML